MAATGVNPEQARPHNRRTVLETVRLNGPVSRSEIARTIGLSIQSVSTITAELVERGFLMMQPGKPKGRGFPAPCYAINPQGGYAIGVTISPRGLQAGLMDLAGDIVSRKEVSEPHLEAPETFRRIAEFLPDLIGDLPEDQILGVGVTLPGPFGIEKMSFVGSTTMEGWSEQDIYDGIDLAVPFPAFVDGVISAAAHGERLYGRGTEFRDFFYLFVDVGLGGAMIFDQRVMRGAYGNASEIGHVPLVIDGDPCPCGNRGCLERYVSMDAYERNAQLIGEDAWLEEIAPVFRAAIVTIENLFEPQTIVLGGTAPQPLLKKLLRLSEDLPASLGARNDRTVPRMVLSSAGADAAIRGAASLAVSRVFMSDDTDMPAPVGKPAPGLFSRNQESNPS